MLLELSRWLLFSQLASQKLPASSMMPMFLASRDHNSSLLRRLIWVGVWHWPEVCEREARILVYLTSTLHGILRCHEAGNIIAKHWNLTEIGLKMQTDKAPTSRFFGMLFDHGMSLASAKANAPTVLTWLSTCKASASHRSQPSNEECIAEGPAVQRGTIQVT